MRLTPEVAGSLNPQLLKALLEAARRRGAQTPGAPPTGDAGAVDKAERPSERKG